MRKTLIAVISLPLVSGCETCGRHPVMCGVGAALVVGGIAVAATHHGGSSQATGCTAASQGNVYLHPGGCVTVGK